MTRGLLAALLGSSLLLVGCSTRGDLETMEQTMIAEFRELNERQDSLAREVRELRRVMLDSLSTREGEALSVRGELGRRLQQLSEDIGRVAALSGQNQRMLADLRQRMASAGGGGGTGGGGGGGAGADTASAATSDGGGTAGEAEGETSSGGSATRLYEAALQQFRRGSYGTARSGLQEFLSQFPDHDLAPDAQYYIAESHARADSPREALDAYSRVVELFPGSRRAATALYKSGLLERERGNLQDARVYLSRVVSGYPDSDEAELAREQLRELGGDGG